MQCGKGRVAMAEDYAVSKAVTILPREKAVSKEKNSSSRGLRSVAKGGQQFQRITQGVRR